MEESSVIENILEAVPVPIFIVDKERKIYELNKAAAELAEGSMEGILHNRLGEALHCIHHEKSGEMCGITPFCGDCVINNAITEVLHGGTIYRKKHHLIVLKDDIQQFNRFLLTASPLALADEELAILVLENVTDF